MISAPKLVLVLTVIFFLFVVPAMTFLVIASRRGKGRGDPGTTRRGKRLGAASRR